MSIMSAGFGSKAGQLRENANAARNTGPGSTASFMEGGQARSRTPLAKNPMTATRASNATREPGQKEDTGPLRVLNNPKRFKNITYPRNVDAVDHYISISAYEERHFPAFGGTRQNTSVVERCILPMPSNLVAGYGQEYRNEAIGVAGVELGRAATAAAGKNKNKLENAFGGGSSGSFFDKAMEGFGAGTSLVADTISTLKDDIGKGAILAGALRLAQDGVGTAAGAASMGLGGAFVAAGASKGFEAFVAAQGRAFNPHTSVLYDAPKLRAFNFQWDLRPKNYHESIQIARAVAFFKYYSAPSFEKNMQNHFFEYPNQFRLKIKHDEFLFSFGDCVLTNFEVDYHGEGTPLYYDATGTNISGNRRLKAPAVVKISTSWQETSIVTKETIETSGR